MQSNEKIYSTFLEELNALEKFRTYYAGIHSSDLLGGDDPDVKRLLEVMAFFSARTRLSSIRNINDTRRRLFEQYFPFLLTPLPAMGILQCDITGRFTEPVTLPKGSEVIIYPENSKVIFRTLHDLNILPFFLETVETIALGQGGTRILLNFRSPYERNENLGILNIYIDHLNNYHSSLKYFYHLRKSLRYVSIFFDEKVFDSSRGQHCQVSYNAPVDPETIVNGDIAHPLQQIRSFFHFPMQNLYLNIHCPPTRASWKKFTIALDVDSNWPENLPLNKDIFQLFTVPVINMRQSFASNVFCDGTQDRYPIRYSDPDSKFVLHSVLGAYSINEEGREPLKPGVFTKENGSYEVELSYQSDTRAENWLLLNYPQAFSDPKQIGIDALWFQPGPSKQIAHDSRVALYDRNIVGVSWDILGHLQHFEESSLKDDPEGLLQILSLQKRHIFNLEEIQCLLKSVGSIGKGYFRIVLPLLGDLKVTTTPQGRAGEVRHTYKIFLKDFDDSYLPLVEAFLEQLVQILNVFTSDAVVTIEARLPRLGKELYFE